MIGKKVAKLRRKRGLTQEKLARMAGVSWVTIARTETGKTTPELATRKKLAKALGVDVTELLD